MANVKIIDEKDSIDNNINSFDINHSQTVNKSIISCKS